MNALDDDPLKSTGGVRAGFRPPMDVVESKLRPPVLRPGIIERTTIVERLLDSQHQSVVLAVAPPGYGKTTLLAQWAARQQRDVAWISIDERDNDPIVLLTETAVAIDRIDPIDSRFLRALTSPSPSGAALTQFAPALSSIGTPVTLILDHVELLETRASRDVVAELAMWLPPGSQLVIGSRGEPPVATALLRARGHVVEIGVDELAMGLDEARSLLAAAGVELDDDELGDIVDKTEGWPVGLYLAALASRASGRSVSQTFTLNGDDRLVGDYLRAELLSVLDPTVVSFLTRTSLLDRLCGPLCDSVLDSTGSQEMLESLELSNLLLVPLDRQRQWYRYHHLFRDLLRADLRRNEPELVIPLQTRAATWYETNGLLESAIDHAQAAGDDESVARLVTWISQPTYQGGRSETVRNWFQWFIDNGVIQHHAPIALLAALSEALQGRPASAERWMNQAEALTYDRPLPDGGTLESWIAALSTLMCRHGVERMRADARLAQQILAPMSPFRAGALFLEAMTHLLNDDPDQADPILAHSADVALAAAASPAAVCAIAERANVAIGRNDWDEAERLGQQALTLVRTQHLEDYMESTPTFTVAAHLAMHRGDVGLAREHITSAARLRPVLSYAIPHAARWLVDIGRAYLQLADAAGARTVLREARDILHQRPDLGNVSRQCAELQQAVDAARGGALGTSALTKAELRVLPLLSTHLTFPEIGERLFLSRHTVKTHALSIYRKLGVSSRSEAIERMHDVGLL